jgi:SAM-dependent methyltransferase
MTEPASRWTAEAAAYDAWFDRPWGAYAMEVEHRLLLASLPAVTGLRVCDAGCGTGRLTHRLEHEGADVIGVDRDRASLVVAARHVAGPLVVGNVHALPFRAGQFDVTFAVTVCEFTADPAVTIAELARVTRPGGFVVVGSLNRRSPWGWLNRQQFDGPPWSGARFLDREALTRIGSAHGSTTWRTGLFSPRALTGARIWGPTFERICSRAFAGFGAFGVLVIHRPSRGERCVNP